MDLFCFLHSLDLSDNSSRLRNSIPRGTKRQLHTNACEATVVIRFGIHGDDKTPADNTTQSRAM